MRPPRLGWLVDDKTMSSASTSIVAGSKAPRLPLHLEAPNVCYLSRLWSKCFGGPSGGGRRACDVLCLTLVTLLSGSERRHCRRHRRRRGGRLF